MRFHDLHSFRPSDPSRSCATGAGFTPGRRRIARALPLAGLAICGVAAPGAAAAPGGGGATIALTPAQQARQLVVRKISCVRGCSTIAAATPGSTLRFQGPRLVQGKRVVYLGGAGTGDDVKAQLRVKKSGSTRIVTATLPKRAKSGPVAIEIAAGTRSAASAEKVDIQETTPIALIKPLEGPGPFFPIVGAWKYGTGAATFGGGRGHQGFDVFAKCGTPLVAALAGKVKYKAVHARAGNYVVFDSGEYDLAYMHLQQPAAVKVGDSLAAGQPVGFVGNTGRADGCHLHIELWKGNWQGLGGTAGTPIDPLPTLKEWEKASAGAKAALR